MSPADREAVRVAQESAEIIRRALPPPEMFRQIVEQGTQIAAGFRSPEELKLITGYDPFESSQRVSAELIQAVAPPKDRRMANTLYEQISKFIQERSKRLGAEEELIAEYCSPNGAAFRVATIGFANPSLLILTGYDADGNECTALMAREAVGLTLTVRKVEPPAKPRQIGFTKPDGA
ncbi:MAG: hypothetical protein ACYDCQ_12410 [Dehalococcoidia bacterium]